MHLIAQRIQRAAQSMLQLKQLLLIRIKIVEAVTTQADNAVATPQATEEAVQTATPESQTSESVAAPVISTTQIQEAVREGGRSLRGQEQ